MGAAIAAVAVGCGPVSQPEAAAVARRWAESHAGGWVLQVDEHDAARGFAFGPSSGPCPVANGTNLTRIAYTTPNYDVSILFSCVSTRPTTLAALREAFHDVTIGALPLNIDLEGWGFSIETPMSSIVEGVEIVSLLEGRFSVKIVTPLLFLFGASTTQQGCLVQDGPAPDRCFVNQPLDFPLTLTLTAPLSLPVFGE